MSATARRMALALDCGAVYASGEPYQFVCERHGEHFDIREMREHQAKHAMEVILQDAQSDELRSRLAMIQSELILHQVPIGTLVDRQVAAITGYLGGTA